MGEIRGETKTIRQLLSGNKYSIDYYQREYKWQTKQVVELLEDLAAKFLDDYDVSHERQEVENYGHYFLGSIIVSNKDGRNYIIDGQQRLTTLTLILIYLHNMQRHRVDPVNIKELIFSEKFAKKSFNLDVEERTPCMEALFNQQTFDETDKSESIRNIVNRYRDIEAYFPQDLTTNALPFFVDWVIENVHLVEIKANSDADAYTIFETMNDRGLSLTPTDMLKGFVINNVTDEVKKAHVNNIWKENVAKLKDIGKDEDADAIKTWLRSQYAETIRERKKGAFAGDFDRLGTEFHRWVREHRPIIGLDFSDDFVRFVEINMTFYTRQYLRLRDASVNLQPGLEEVFYNAQYEFTLQYPVLLASLLPADQEATVLQKIKVVSAYIDILLARRVWNYRSNAYSTMQYAMFLLMRELRGKDVPELISILTKKLAEDADTFSSNDRLRIHQQNHKAVHQILARITDYIEREAGRVSRYPEYVSTVINDRYEVEHIWANKYDYHKNEFASEADFTEYRNRIGGLLLLPKSFNASFGALPYSSKHLEYGKGQNLLARSLHSGCYAHNPGFLSFLTRTGIPFKAYSQFNKAELDERQDLYRQIAEKVWSPERLYQ